MKRKLYTLFSIAISLLSLFSSWGWALPQEISQERLDRVKQKYDFVNWGPNKKEVIPGVKISDISFQLLNRLKMKKMWDRDNYHIGKINGTPYSIIRQYWRSEDKKIQLDVTMVVSPTFEAIKEFLISRYAHTQMGVQRVKSAAHQYGLKIGDVCFLSEAKQKGSFSTIDFIRDNVLIMMRTEGDLPIELDTIANELDGRLQMETPFESYSQLKEIPTISHFSSQKTKIKLGETVPLDIEINNPTQRELRYFWQMTGGGVEKDAEGNFLYYAGEKGKHTIIITVVNELGLQNSKSLTIDVVR